MTLRLSNDPILYSLPLSGCNKPNFSWWINIFCLNWSPKHLLTLLSWFKHNFYRWSNHGHLTKIMLIKPDIFSFLKFHFSTVLLNHQLTFVRYGGYSVYQIPESSAGPEASVQFWVEAGQTSEWDSDIGCVQQERRQTTHSDMSVADHHSSVVQHWQDDDIATQSCLYKSWIQYYKCGQIYFTIPLVEECHGWLNGRCIKLNKTSDG